MSQKYDMDHRCFLRSISALQIYINQFLLANLWIDKRANKATSQFFLHPIQSLTRPQSGVDHISRNYLQMRKTMRVAFILENSLNDW